MTDGHAAAPLPVGYSPGLWNPDLAPSTAERRTWTTWNIAALWVGMAHLPQLLPAFVGLNTGEAVCFLIFWAINVWIVLRGMESIKFLETWGSPFLLLVGAALFVWAWSKAGGLEPMLRNPSHRGS